MSEIDIVARLQLRAEQFSSETGQRFAELKTRAASSAQEIRQSFSGAFSEVQKLASTALQLPRTKSGSLDLSGEIAQLRQSEVAAEQNAIAMRELSVAQAAAADAARGGAQALRLEADAAAVAALASERDAEAIRNRIAALQAVQTELNRTTSATSLEAGALDRGSVSAAQKRAALQQLGFQMNDVATQYASGTAALMIFAQQSGQVVQALSMMTEGTKGFLGWLGGWQGAVATAVVIAAVPFIAKLMEGGDALEEQTAKLRKNAEEAELSRRAKQRFAQTELGTREEVEALTIALKNQNDALRTNAERNNISAKSSAAKIDTLLAQRESELATAKRQVEIERQKVAERAGEPGALAEAEADVVKLRTAVADLRSQAAIAKNALLETRKDLAAEAAKRQNDPEAQINRKYDDADRGLIALAKKRATAEETTNGILTARLKLLEKEREGELQIAREREQKQRQKPRSVSLGDQLERESSARLLGDAERYRGVGEGSKTLAALFAGGGKGIAIDPEKDAWCAAFVNAVLAGRGITGTGKLNARSFLGYGDKTDRPQKGDIVVSRRGNDPAKGHVGFYEGVDAKGNILVLGGNTGNKVATQRVARGDVLGFRRAPDAADAYKDDQKGQRALERQEDAAARVAEAIARINANWDEQPRLIDRAAADTRALEAIIKDNEGKADAASQKIVADARAALTTIGEGLERPMREYLRAQEENVAIQGLILQGRDVEARALQDALRLKQSGQEVDEAALRTVLARAEQEERVARAIDAQRRQLSIYSGAANDFQRTFDRFLDEIERKPGKAVGNLLKGWVDGFRSLRNDLLSEQLFGGLEQDLQDYLKGRRADPANDELARRTKRAATSLDALSIAFDRATGRLDGPGVAPIASNDNFAGFSGGVSDLKSLLTNRTMLGGLGGADGAANSLVGTSSDERALSTSLDANRSALMRATDAYTFMGGRLMARLDSFGIKLPKSVQDGLGRSFGPLMQSVAIGQTAGSVFGKIAGGKQSQTGAALGGLAGSIVGGPIGAAIGGIIGSTIGGLFKKTKSGSATLSIDSGRISTGAATGNSSSYRAAATGLAGGVNDLLAQVAQAVGGEVTGSGSVSIGKRKDKFVVDPTGRGRTKGSGTQSFANEEEAYRAAVADLLSENVIAGISDASKRILASRQKLETATEKAAMIEAIPKQLKAMLDPVGAALDDLNGKWAKTVAALQEGGASAEQMAQAEQLYRLQLAETKATTAEASASLKDFLKSLSLGSNSPLSLRDQEQAALSALEPFLAQIDAGQRVDQDKYRDAAQAFLDVERQLGGSTDRYFEQFARVQDYTNRAIATIDKAVPIREAKPDPFAQATATNTATQVELLAQISQQLQALGMAGVLGFGGGVETGGVGGGSSGFIGSGRNFVNAV